MAPIAGLAAILFATWLLLSGHYVLLFIALGLASVALSVEISRRMGVIDGEALALIPRGLRYWPWLAWEVVKSNIDVARLILTPGRSISPTLVRLKCSQRTSLGRVIYANSITLTPGTVTVDLVGDELVVHALTREAAAALQDGEMDRRVAAMETRG